MYDDGVRTLTTGLAELGGEFGASRLDESQLDMPIWWDILGAVPVVGAGLAVGAAIYESFMRATTE
jgi:hypothetical protein